MDEVILLPAGPDGRKRQGDGHQCEEKGDRFMGEEAPGQSQQSYTLIGRKEVEIEIEVEVQDKMAIEIERKQEGPGEILRVFLIEGPLQWVVCDSPREIITNTLFEIPLTPCGLEIFFSTRCIRLPQTSFPVHQLQGPPVPR